MRQRFSSSFYKKVLLAVGLLVLLIMVGNVFLKRQITKKIEAAGAQFATFRYDDLDVGLLSGKIHLTALELDWKAADENTENDLEKNLGLTASVAAVRGLSWWNLLVNNHVKINAVKIENPNISLFQKDRNDDVFKQLFSKEKKDSIGKENIIFDIKNIEISNGKIAAYIDSLRWFGLDSLKIDTETFNFNKNKQNTPFSFEELTWQLSNLYFRKADGLHALQIKRASGNKANNSLSISNLQLNPLISKRQFSDYLEYKTARLDLKIPNLTATDFRWDSLLFSQQLLAKRLSITDPRFLIFDDKNVPRCKACYKAFPQEVLLKAKLPISIDSVVINDGFIEYEHLVPEHTQAGSIAFKNLQATLINITNISEKIAKKSIATLYAQTDVEGDGKFYLTTDFHLTDPQYRFTYQGDLRQMDLQKINSMIEFSARVSIKNGQINRLQFSGEGNNLEGRGDMDFNYENLDIAFLTEDYQVGKKLLSGLVNGLLIRDNNPNKKDYRKGKMYTKRLKNRAIFHLWWQSILSGMKSTMLPKLFLPDELE